MSRSFNLLFAICALVVAGCGVGDTEVAPNMDDSELWGKGGSGRRR